MKIITSHNCLLARHMRTLICASTEEHILLAIRRACATCTDLSLPHAEVAAAAATTNSEENLTALDPESPLLVSQNHVPLECCSGGGGENDAAVSVRACRLVHKHGGRCCMHTSCSAAATSDKPGELCRYNMRPYTTLGLCILWSQLIRYVSLHWVNYTIRYGTNIIYIYVKQICCIEK